MTIRRSERSPEDVLYAVACEYPGGVEALANRLGISAKTLYAKLSSSTSDRCPTTKEFSQIIDFAQDAGRENALDPLYTLCYRHGGIFVPIAELNEVSDECILRGAMQAMEHLGAITGTVNEALADGEICEKELDKIEGTFRRLLTASCAWLARIKGRAKRDAGKRKSIFSKVKKSDSHDFASTAN